jgi:hypothetical protein
LTIFPRDSAKASAIYKIEIFIRNVNYVLVTQFFLAGAFLAGLLAGVFLAGLLETGLAGATLTGDLAATTGAETTHF